MHVFLPQTFRLTYVTGYWPAYTKAVHGSIAIKKKKRTKGKGKVGNFQKENIYGWEFYKKKLTLTGY